MTNTQLYLAIGIPLIFNMGTLFLLFQVLNGRIDRLDGKIDRLDGKVDDTRLELTSRIDRLDRKVDDTRLELTSRIDRVADATATFYRELDKQETILGRHDAAIEKLLAK